MPLGTYWILERKKTKLYSKFQICSTTMKFILLKNLLLFLGHIQMKIKVQFKDMTYQGPILVLFDEIVY